MGYWAKDGSYVYDKKDIINKEQLLKATGGATFDERVDFTERQNSMKPYGEPIKTTGGATFDERVRDTEVQVMLANERDKDNIVILNDLINKFPSTKEGLVNCLEALDYRLDFLKQLVENYRDQFINIASQYKNDYTQEASDIVNAKLTEYLCLIETLKSQGYNFGSEFNSYNRNDYYDSNKPQLLLEDIMSVMHVRRKNEADVSIIFPLDYNLDDMDFEQKGDAVTIINNVNEHLKNNPYMNVLWNRAGYVALENEIKRAM